MEADVNVFSAGVETVILGMCNSRLVVREKSERFVQLTKKFNHGGVKPDNFLGGMDLSDILSLSGRKCDEFLML